MMMEDGKIFLRKEDSGERTSLGPVASPSVGVDSGKEGLTAVGNGAVREATSVYFNSIIREDVTPMSIDGLPESVIAEFNEQMRVAFGEDAEDYILRVKYLIPYILQSINWDEYGLPLQGWQLKYYYHRERFLSKTHMDYEEFVSHTPLQNSIEELGLEPLPTFEFILFLKYYYGMRSELRYSSIEQLAMAKSAVNESAPDQEASMDICVGGKHFRFSNARFIKALLNSIDETQLKSGVFVNEFTEGGSRDKVRALDYYMVKTLLDFLPIKREASRGGKYTQAERNFGLSVLSLCGRLPDVDREGVCSKVNNATFDKLMRDFKGCRIPFAMELFL